jgi:hypothetical protein
MALKLGYGNDKSNKGPFAGFLLNSIAKTPILSFHRLKPPFKRAIVESLMGRGIQIKWPIFDRIVVRRVIRLAETSKGLGIASKE